MTDTPTVAVRGEAVREVEPELARLTVAVEARDADRERTLRRLAERTEALRDLLDRYAGAIERRETGGVTVYPEIRMGERVRAYVGSVSTLITFSDFSDLGEVVLALADQDLTTVHGPYWSLRPDSAAYGEARRAAIADALVRAREYADALGARLVRLIELADAGLIGDQGPQPMMMAARAEFGGAPRLDLDPVRQTVRAVVEARFGISEPAVLG
ncbi:SIMPL domain-containing protein [Planosporangium sp. 12N6]|uniref:SIMPL domain-containing protein n=1 Tax=Planosporangium spinosum TaxID=3402278 RepID=UPI003CECEE6D